MTNANTLEFIKFIDKQTFILEEEQDSGETTLKIKMPLFVSKENFLQQIIREIKCSGEGLRDYLNWRQRISCVIHEYIQTYAHKEKNLDLIPLIKYLKSPDRMSTDEKIELYKELLSVVDINAREKQKDPMFLLIGYMAINDPQILKQPNKDHYIRKITEAIPSPKVGIMLYRSDEKDKVAMENLFPIKLFEIIEQNTKESASRAFSRIFNKWVSIDGAESNDTVNNNSSALIWTPIAKKYYKDFCRELNKCAQSEGLLKGDVATCDKYYKKRCVIAQ